MTINPDNKFNLHNPQLYSEIVNKLVSRGKKINIPAKEHILFEGELCDFFFYIEEGCFRAYRTLEDQEVIIGFSFKGDLDTCPYSFFNNIPSLDSIEALTDCRIIKIHKRELEKLKDDDPKTIDFIQYMLSFYVETILKRIIEFKTFTAEENYKNLLKRQPLQVSHIPLKYLSSYLGITPERLSRIRRKVQLI